MKLDACGLPPVNPLPHPTPQHIRGCIEKRLSSLPADEGEILPLYAAIMAVDAGISDACREHDEAQRK